MSRRPPPHRFLNDTDEEAHVLTELRPALNSEIFFETAYGLAVSGKTDKNSIPNLQQQAVTLNGVNKDEIYLAWPPIPVQRAFLAALAPVERVLGYKDHYPKYSAVDASGAGGTGPPSTTTVLARGVAVAVSLLVASLILVGWAQRLSKG